ncbi:acyltransferase [Streptococcus thoraltensis]|uniref:acyltransferase n=1 Tax=Streptococcus thoraltensis TaxID=55085 RepID=UPI000380729C|nr:acyltransferase [Streptococcus thoraltensis]MDY4761375.1 acyltransferase [Streptococcus thoraltensis]
MEKRLYNAGIDFLRIFAMFMIVVTHVLGKGGVRDSVAGTVDIHFVQTWVIQASVYVAVNCYALISGYVGFRSNFRYSKVVNLWLQVAFYSIGITLFFLLLGKEISGNDWLDAFFPVIRGQYWYVTAYFGLMLTMPFFNIALPRMELSDLGKMIATGFIVFSLLPVLLDTSVSEFSLSKGFSMTWLILLYVVGAFLARIDLKKYNKPLILIGIYVLSIAATLVLKHAVSEKWYWYTSPTISLGALALFVLFANLDISSSRILVKFIKFFAPATFGVYLVHLHPLIVKFAMRDFAENFVDQSPLVFPIIILGVSLLIFLGSILIEKVRIWLFKTLQVSKIAAKIDNWLTFKNKVKKI